MGILRNGNYFYKILLIAEILILIFSFLTGHKYFGYGAIFWGLIICVVYAVRPSSMLHTFDMSSVSKSCKIICLSVIIAVIAVCTIPMAWNPVWNGEIPTHHEQYEYLARSFAEGHLYIDIEVDPLLAEMENPYSPAEREKLNVKYAWDHAYYNGHYYMYFGVVPVFILFLPYLLITGHSLTTYHATQIFVTIFIIGMFVLLRYVAERFFPKISFCVYLMSALMFTLISILYCTSAPSLYCTAIAAGLCFEIWSIYFFIRAAYDSRTRGLLILTFVGALLGSLVFGCRPTIALANVLIFPLIPKIFQKVKDAHGKFLAALVVPYLLVGAALMIYNFMRFGSPFEFGLSYQLTLADQRLYGNFFERLNLTSLINGIFKNFSELFTNYPIFLMLFIFVSKKFRHTLKRLQLNGLYWTIILLPIVITVFQIQWSDLVLERYRLDFYYLLSILSFISIGILCTKRRNDFVNFGVSIFSLAMILRCFWLFLIPADFNLTDYYKEIFPQIEKIIFMEW